MHGDLIQALLLCLFTGGRQNYENQNEGEGSSKDGKDRHRLPEAPRRLLQMADQTQAHHPRRPLLRGITYNFLSMIFLHIYVERTQKSINCVFLALG